MYEISFNNQKFILLFLITIKLLYSRNYSIYLKLYIPKRVMSWYSGAYTGVLGKNQLYWSANLSYQDCTFKSRRQNSTINRHIATCLAKIFTSANPLVTYIGMVHLLFSGKRQISVPWISHVPYDILSPSFSVDLNTHPTRRQVSLQLSSFLPDLPKRAHSSV